MVMARNYFWTSAAIVMVLSGATQARADVHFFSGSFAPSGDSPNIRWDPDSADKYEGLITSISTPGIANGTLSFSSDPALEALGPLPVRAVLGGYFFGQYSYAQPMPVAIYGVEFFYEGSTPLIYKSHSYAAGTDILGSYSGGIYFDTSYISSGQSLGAGFGSAVFDIPFLNPAYSGWDWGVSPSPAVHFATGALSPYPYIDAGQGVMTMSFWGMDLPEPATWALMLAGFGLAGAQLRRRAVVAA